MVEDRGFLILSRMGIEPRPDITTARVIEATILATAESSVQNQ